MNIKTSTPRWVRVALLACALASFGTGGALLAQQAQAPALAAPVTAAPAPAAPATATPAAAPAPHESALFERNDPNAPTLASAKAAHESALMSGGDNHTIVVSTLVLVLAVVILVLLIT